VTTTVERDALDRIAVVAATAERLESVPGHLRTLLGRIRSLAADAGAAPTHGQVAARIGSHGLCDRYERHGPHLETTGIVDNGGNVVLHQCPGQSCDCRNCEDRKCMSCVMRYWHERCADDCPDCCGPPGPGTVADPGAQAAWEEYHGACRLECAPQRRAFLAGWSRRAQAPVVKEGT
jgi:hypothetical protein